MKNAAARNLPSQFHGTQRKQVNNEIMFQPKEEVRIPHFKNRGHATHAKFLGISRQPCRAPCFYYACVRGHIILLLARLVPAAKKTRWGRVRCAARKNQTRSRQRWCLTRGARRQPRSEAHCAYADFVTSTAAITKRHRIAYHKQEHQDGGHDETSRSGSHPVRRPRGANRSIVVLRHELEPYLITEDGYILSRQYVAPHVSEKKSFLISHVGGFKHLFWLLLPT